MHRHEYDVPYLFHQLGIDVYFYVAPFHGRRTPSQALLGGQLHPSSDLVRTNEAFIQTATELRSLISAILQRNGAPLGMMGSSLGGYTSALMASIDDRLDFVIPVLPPASMAHILWDHGRQDELRTRAEELGMTRERFHHLWSLHSPLSYTPKVPWERRLIITGLGDTVVTADHTRDLWEHWGRPRHFRFAWGHAGQLQRERYHREVGRFLRDIGVVSGRGSIGCDRLRSVACPMGERARGKKRPCRLSDTAYHRPLSCHPSPSWWNILPTGALRTFFRRGDSITPVAELARPGPFLPPDVRASAGTLSPPRSRWGGSSKLGGLVEHSRRARAWVQTSTPGTIAAVLNAEQPIDGHAEMQPRAVPHGRAGPVEARFRRM
jgi:hypothetical protein